MFADMSQHRYVAEWHRSKTSDFESGKWISEGVSSHGVGLMWPHSS